MIVQVVHDGTCVNNHGLGEGASMESTFLRVASLRLFLPSVTGFSLAGSKQIPPKANVRHDKYKLLEVNKYLALVYSRYFRTSLWT